MTRRLVVALLGAITMTLSLLTAPLAAHADGESNAVGECLSSDEVWLLIVDEEGSVIANQCVGTPATGIAAIEAAGVAIGYDSSNFVCTLGGHPSECPASFNGQFWNYWQGSAGAEYAFAQTGPAESVPAGGTIEAWCYNKADEEGCTPPTLKIVQNGTEVAPAAGATAQDLPVTGAEATQGEAAEEETPEDSGTMGWIVVGIAVVAVGAGLIAWQVGRRKKTGPLGGR